MVDECRVLVIGKAKTGTTFLSKSVQNSLPNCSYMLEPKGHEPELFSHLNGNHVVKVIYEHWDRCPNLRQAMIMNELPLKFDKRVLIVRDPRDELVSRLLYIVKPLKDQNRLTPKSMRQWLKLLKKKESAPDSISLMELMDHCDALFGTHFLRTFTQHLDDFHQFFTTKPNQLFAISYEAIIDRRVENLEEYLGFSLDFDLEVENVIRQTRRSGRYGNWLHFFLQEDIEVLRPRFDAFVAQLGYSAWSLPKKQHLNIAEVSGYVSHLAKM